MSVKFADAQWKGDLKSGSGTVKTGSGALEGNYTFASRFENGKGTNPEELIAAAHAGCYSMALSNELAKAGYEPVSVATKAEVTLEMTNGPEITLITLHSKAVVNGIEEDEFMKIAEAAKVGCPISKALKGPEIKLNITLNKA
ncbi:MAG: OsmC family protein [Balneolales bacterium]|nr:OsmC family protein [Balneolales bacterium]